jgi:hypothetical protein
LAPSAAYAKVNNRLVLRPGLRDQGNPQANVRREKITNMVLLTRRALACGVLCSLLWSASATGSEPAQSADAAAIVQRIDAVVEARYQTVLGFTNIEHYAVFHGKDQTHPVAEMTVKDTYRKGIGKTYTVLSQTGSEVIFRFGLKPLLDNETLLNQPGNVQQSWFDSANYEMKPKPGAIERINGRDCLVVGIMARRKAPNMLDGNIWIDAKDYSLAQIQGIATKSPSPFAGTTHMMRQYAQIDGFSMATHARAESNSLFFGHTVVTVDYSDYQLQLDPRK